MKYIEPDKKIIDFIKSDSLMECTILSDLQKKVLNLKFNFGFDPLQISKKEEKSYQQIRNILMKSFRMIELYLNEKSPSMLIKDSTLSVRVKNAFSYDENIKCLKDFNNMPIYKLMRRNFGNQSIMEIQNYISDLGFSLKFPEEEKILKLNKRFNGELFKDFNEKDLIHWIYCLSKLLKEK